MRHLKPDLKCGHIGKRSRIAPGVDSGQRWRTHVRNKFPVGRREIENGEIAMLMPHGRAECELQIDQIVAERPAKEGRLLRSGTECDSRIRKSRAR